MTSSDDEKIDIYLYGPQLSLPLDQLPNLLLHTPSGATLPLSAVASIDETMDTSVIRRVDGSRTVTLNVIPPPSIALEAGVEQAQRMLERLRHEGVLSSAVAISISGASDQLNATRDALMGNFLIAIVIVYLLLVAIFSHWGYPLLILTSIPLGVVGGIMGLAAMNAVGSLLPLIGIAPLSQPFDMITMLGFLILMGTVVNNPILVVDQARRRLHDKQLSVQEAVFSSSSNPPAPDCDYHADNPMRAFTAGIFTWRRHRTLPWCRGDCLIWLAGSLHRDGDVPASIDDKRTAA